MHTTVIDARARMLGHVAVVTYIRLTQYLDKYGRSRAPLAPFGFDAARDRGGGALQHGQASHVPVRGNPHLDSGHRHGRGSGGGQGVWRSAWNLIGAGASRSTAGATSTSTAPGASLAQLAVCAWREVLPPPPRCPRTQRREGKGRRKGCQRVGGEVVSVAWPVASPHHQAHT